MADEPEGKGKIDYFVDELAEIHKILNNQISIIAQHDKDIKYLKKELFL